MVWVAASLGIGSVGKCSRTTSSSTLPFALARYRLTAAHLPDYGVGRDRQWQKSPRKYSDRG
jgi:hypothetical protein